MEEFLQTIGLTKLESKTYNTLLNYGEMKVSKLLKIAKLNSGRIYDILNSLQQKGFISIIIKDGIKYISPSPPEILREFINQKEEEIKKQKEEVEKILPFMIKNYHSQINEEKIEIFMGKKGLEAAYKILFSQAKEHKELFIIGSSTQFKKENWAVPYIINTIYPLRKKLKLKIKKILDKAAKKQLEIKKDSSKVRYLDFTTLTSFEVLGDVVILELFLSDIICIVIQNKNIANDFKKQFNTLWDKAEK